MEKAHSLCRGFFFPHWQLAHPEATEFLPSSSPFSKAPSRPVPVGKEKSSLRAQNSGPNHSDPLPRAPARLPSRSQSCLPGQSSGLGGEGGGRQTNQELQCSMTCALIEISPGPSGAWRTSSSLGAVGKAAQSWWQVILELDTESS